MTKIPSIEKTDDYIYRAKFNKGAPIEEPDDPHLLLFQIFPQATGPFHSMDITILRDGHRANDIEFRSFEHFISSDESSLTRCSNYMIAQDRYPSTIIF